MGGQKLRRVAREAGTREKNECTEMDGRADRLSEMTSKREREREREREIEREYW